jgi:hypothetical protein
LEKRKGELQKAQGMNVVSREKRRRSVREKGRIRAGGTQREGKQREAEGRHMGARKRQEGYSSDAGES